ncbi:phage portal protein family protein [Mycobacterium sp. TJFP1]
MAPKTAAPRVEKGYVNPVPGTLTAWGLPMLDQFEANPDLTWPNSVWTYGRMVREDARIASVLRALGLPIRRTVWRIRPNGARDEVVEHVAVSLGLPIEGDDQDRPTPRTRGGFSWSRHLAYALTAQQFGHAVCEILYRADERGRFHLRKLAPRPQSSIAYWNVDRDGGLISIQQWPAGTFGGPGMVVMAPSQMGPAIGVDRLVVYTRDMDPGIWIGNSLLRPAYKHWVWKDELMRIEAAAARRHGIGVPVIKANEEESDDDARMSELLDIASEYGGGESAGLALTAGEEFGIASPTGTPMDPRRAIEYHDHQMALVALAHFLNLEGKGGSYALASVQENTFVQSVQTVAADIRDVSQAHIVEDIVDRNWGPDEPAPLLVFDEIGSRQDATAAALQMLVNAGLLTPDARLEQFLRTASGLPSPDPDTARDVDESDQADDTPESTEAAAQTRSAAARARQRREHPKSRQESLW